MAAVTLISSIPTFVSPEEHRTIVRSTPSSFSDIPPVLRHKEESVSVTLEPSLEGFGEEDGKEGTLYVLTSVLIFMSKAGKGFQIEYPLITLHAISRGDKDPSIYCQLDESSAEAVKMVVDAEKPVSNGKIEKTSTNGEVAEEEEEEEEQDQEEQEEALDMRELNIIPTRVEALEPIFEALSICAALHPDPPGSDDEDDFDEALIDRPDESFEVFTGTEDEELSEVGRAALDYIESIIYNPFEKETEEEEREEASGKHESVEKS